MKMIPMLIALIIITVVLTVLGLSLAGIVTLPGVSNGNKTQQNGKMEAPPGKQLVPLSVSNISAFTKVTRDHIVDPRTMQPRLVAVSVNGTDDPPIVDPRQILGRVLKRDKQAGYAFTEDDFTPQGTTEGIGAAVPPGYRAVTIDASRIKGAYSLNANDRIDLLATSRFGVAMLSKGRAEDLAAAGVLSSYGGGTVSRVVAKNAIVIRPVTIRNEQVETASGLVGTNKRFVNKRNYEITLAIDPNDAAAVNEAFASNDLMTAFARSTLPGAPENDIFIRPIELPGEDQEVTATGELVPINSEAAKEPEPDQAAVVETPSTMIETVVGTRKQRIVFQGGS
ncbi:MAG: hypothetical protein SF028_05320 [Candidatus Sumerlaeia bacterium]|nr:hypothetical protein [Candidatus Sumerlaeia bacterium]